MRHWGFRVSSRPEAGAGHVARSIALADALGDDVVMFLDPTGPDPAVAGRLPPACRRERSAESCDELLAAIGRQEIQAAVLDSYALVSETMSLVAQQAFTVAIDDLGRPRRCQFVVRPGFSAHPEAVDDTGVIGGPQYALLDKVFASDPPARERVLVQAPRVLVSFGARDSKDVSGLIISALTNCFDEIAGVTVVLGEAAPHRAKLMSTYAAAPVAFASPSRAVDVRALYDRHDLSIGAGGVGLFERMAAGLPGIVISIADNQHSNTSAAVATGAAISGGCLRDFDPPSFRDLFKQVVADRALRARVAQCGRALVDGHGCERAAGAMLAACEVWQKDHVSL